MNLENGSLLIPLNLFQVAAHLFQAGANIVKLGIQKTDQTENPVQFLGSY